MLIELQKVDLSTATAQAADATFLGQKAISEADGVLVITRPGEWSQANLPGLAAQSTTTKAAGGAGVRHVCTGISCTFSTAATAQSGSMDFVLRDGATGVGTILWGQRFLLDVNKNIQWSLSGLNIVGSVNTAMTLEMVAAGAAGSVGSVTLTGYDAA